MKQVRDVIILATFCFIAMFVAQTLHYRVNVRPDEAYIEMARRLQTMDGQQSSRQRKFEAIADTIGGTNDAFDDAFLD